MQLYSHFPIIAGKTERAEELQSSFASKITLICANVRGVEVPSHERPLSIKATLIGEEVFAFGHQRVPLTPGKVLIAPASHSYSSSVAAQPPTSAISLFFPNHLTRSAIALYQGNYRHMLMECADDLIPLGDFPAHCSPIGHRALPLLQNMATGLDETETWDLSLRCLTLAVEAAMQARGEIANIPAIRPSVQQELFRRASLAREAIEDCPEFDWSLEELSKIACLSQFHLHRVFSASFGQTPFQYLKKKRVAVAQQLLSSTSHPIKAIAGRVGFESVSSFIRSFRIEAGISPAQYREANAA